MSTPTTLISTDSPAVIRKIAGDPNFISEMNRLGEANGHKFKVGDICRLHGLVDYPEYNGEQVEVEGIREDGPKGRAYYVKGRINVHCNWVYEYRMEAMS